MAIVSDVRVKTYRRVWAALSTSRITCLPTPEGHRIKDPLVWEHGGLRCRHRFGNGTECGRLVYLVGGGLVTPNGSPLVMLAEVTPAELHEMASAKMDYERALDFLGVRFSS